MTSLPWFTCGRPDCLIINLQALKKRNTSNTQHQLESTIFLRSLFFRCMSISKINIKSRKKLLKLFVFCVFNHVLYLFLNIPIKLIRSIENRCDVILLCLWLAKNLKFSDWSLEKNSRKKNYKSQKKKTLLSWELVAKFEK